MAEVQSLMEQVPEELLAQPEIISLAGMIGLAEQASALPDTATLQAAVDANADDHGARHTLAQALLGRGQPETGADHLLEIMRRDREWNDDGARQALLALFDALLLDRGQHVCRWARHSSAIRHAHIHRDDFV